MAVVTVTEIAARAGSINGKGVRTYQRQFRCWTNTNLDSVIALLSATGIPRIGDAYVTQFEYDLGAVCQSVKPDMDEDNPRRWTVSAEYSSEQQNPDKQEPNPTLRPAEIEIDGETYQKVVRRDFFGRGYVNSAGEPFEGGLTIDDTRPVLTVKRNEVSYDVLLGVTYQDATNSDAFFGALPGQAKCHRIKAVLKYENNITFDEVTYVIQFQREGWDDRPLDQGYHELVNGKLSLIRDERTNEVVSSPQPLNGKGKRLPPPKLAEVLAAGATVGELGGALCNGNVSIANKGVAVGDFGAVEANGDLGEVLSAQIPAGTEAHAGGAVELTNSLTWSHLPAGSAVPNPIPGGRTYVQWNYCPGVFLRFSPRKILPFAALNLP